MMQVLKVGFKDPAILILINHWANCQEMIKNNSEQDIKPALQEVKISKENLSQQA